MNRNAFAGVLLATAILNACAAADPADTGSAPTPTTQSAAPTAPATATQGDASRAVFNAINEQRRRAGCDDLTWDATAARVAQAHSEDMVRRGALVHESADGKQAWDRLRAQRVSFGEAAENITRTVPGAGAQGAVKAWVESAGHRANIVNCRFTHTGVGMSGEYWTQVFYTPAR